MHLVIDDTYSSGGVSLSKYVTGDRRTHIAVAIPDNEVSNLRMEMQECLKIVTDELKVKANEFHFVDIYNRNGPWSHLVKMENLRIFEFFAEIYNHYKWKVHIQTIDDQTFEDHPAIKAEGVVDGLDLSKRSDLSLFFLLVKLKHIYTIRDHGQLTLIVDNRTDGELGAPVGYSVFSERVPFFKGSFESSSKEPLLQISDFIAFCINRTTNLGVKSSRTDTDYAFLDLVANMGINSDELKTVQLERGFSVSDFDERHRLDRVTKGLE
ncbi:hypothetical protein [Pseudomonas sp.]|jgi:hypothetical protein|uniref:hypothetical protein n=1 Tax=Pseudomonas sp. TaxID=306 RepID=UPI002E34CEB1|nr:hypothetical protein [Pseudomonas sp.]HEX4548953.1 hypothetical protein [Pseudomonas sp.]